MSRLAYLILLAVASSSGLAAAQPRNDARGDGVVQPRAVAPRGSLSADERNTISIFESVSPSVVYITTAQYVRDFFSRNVLRVPQGTGSGFIWDNQGRVVTNYHVIRGAQEALVRLGDQRSYQARLVGASPEHDLAVLQIDVPADLPPPIPIGSSGDLKVGQTVLAIGNPFGLDHTLTTGIVSALHRTVENESGGDIDDVIQTDAAINPGNSGGPLIDSAGRLVGINTMIYSPSGAYAGIGFAVPVDTINRVVPRIIGYGRYVRPQLGVGADDRITQELFGPEGAGGVLVLSVSADSPAARADLRATRQERNGNIVIGDIIAAVDGQPVKSQAELVAALDMHEFGDRVTLTVIRNDRPIEIPVTLDAARETRAR